MTPRWRVARARIHQASTGRKYRPARSGLGASRGRLGGVTGCVLLALMASSSVQAEVLSYQCTFPSFADTSGLQDQTEFGFEIKYDDVANNAFIVGNAGMSPLTPLVGADSLAFVEVTPSGSVMMTTIGADGVAVHSRHSVVVGSLVPSQHYGTCVIGN